MYFVRFWNKYASLQYLFVAFFLFYHLWQLVHVACDFVFCPKIRPTRCYTLPDETNFLEIGGVSPSPHTRPGSVGPLVIILFTVKFEIRSRISRVHLHSTIRCTQRLQSMERKLRIYTTFLPAF